MCISCILDQMKQNYCGIVVCCLKYAREINKQLFLNYCKNNPYKLELKDKTFDYVKASLHANHNCILILNNSKCLVFLVYFKQFEIILFIFYREIKL